MRQSISMLLLLLIITGCAQSNPSTDATGFLCEKQDYGLVEVRELILDSDGTIKKLISTSRIEFDASQSADVTIEDYQMFLAQLYESLVSQDDGINYSSQIIENIIEVIMTFDMVQISDSTLVWLGLPIENTQNRIIVEQYIDNLESNGYQCKTTTATLG
ncbi:hypothetical protein [Erysipelothrix larvae]|nr:hypothetical protein [Erysipelothrix larvae]